MERLQASGVADAFLAPGSLLSSWVLGEAVYLRFSYL